MVTIVLEKIPRFELSRRKWSTLNRIHRGQWKCNHLMNKTESERWVNMQILCRRSNNETVEECIV